MDRHKRWRSPRARLIATTALASLLVAALPVGIDHGGHLRVSTAVADSCCFTGETAVLLADGSERPIAAIRAGDRVIGQHGRANRVLGIECVRLGDRSLHAINDGAPFFTAEHPFLTLGGWKSVAPALSRAEAAGLEVSQLAVGDLLTTVEIGTLRVEGATALLAVPRRRVVRLSRLTACDAPADMPVFNLLLDGDHSYVANGYVVHNKDGGSGGGSDGGSDGGADGGSGGGSDGGSGGSGGGSGSDGGSGPDGGSGGGEGGSSGPGGSGGESGGSSSGPGGGPGESGHGSGSERGSGGALGFDGTTEPAAPDIDRQQERDMISKGWP